MARADFIRQLEALGYKVEDLGENRLAFKYRVPVGKMIDKEVSIGFVVGDEFPASPPSGPHISPRLFPNQSGGTHPTGGIHNSPFGDEWHYWSRPYNGWAKSDRSVRAYLAHIRHLFDTL